MTLVFGPRELIAAISWYFECFFFSSRRRHTRYWRDWSSDVCSSDLKYSAIKHNISSSLGSYKNAVINNDKSGISQNTKSIMDQTRQVGELISNINSSLNKLSKIPNKNIFDNLPKEMKDLYSSMEDLDNVSKSSSNNVLKLAETFGVALNDNMSKSLKEATKNIKENADSVNQMATNNAGFFNSLSRGLSGIDRKSVV